MNKVFCPTTDEHTSDFSLLLSAKYDIFVLLLDRRPTFDYQLNETSGNFFFYFLKNRLSQTFCVVHQLMEFTSAKEAVYNEVVIHTH